MNLALYALGLAALLANQRVDGNPILGHLTAAPSTVVAGGGGTGPRRGRRLAGQWDDDWVYNSVVNKATGKGCTDYPFTQHQQCPNGYFACGYVVGDAAGCLPRTLEPAAGERDREIPVPQGTLKCCLTDDSGTAARAHSLFHVLARGLTRVLVSRATQTAPAAGMSAASKAYLAGGARGFKLNYQQSDLFRALGRVEDLSSQGFGPTADNNGERVPFGIRTCQDECAPSGSQTENPLCTQSYCDFYKPGRQFHHRCSAEDAMHDYALAECQATCGMCPASPPPAYIPDDSFTVIFVSDMESGYRGWKESDCREKVRTIAGLKSAGKKFPSGHPIIPELVINGGDNYDDVQEDKGSRTQDKVGARSIWDELDNKIPMITTNGNHDGNIPETRNFVRDRFRYANGFAGFTSQELNGGEGYKAEFKGVQIATFLHTDNTHGQPTRAALTAMETLTDKAKPTLFVNHYPLADGGDLERMIFDHSKATALSGHAHKYKRTPHATTMALTESFVEHTAPYPHEWHSMSFGAPRSPGHELWKKETCTAADETCPDEGQRANQFLALRVSPTRGVVEVTKLDAGGHRNWPDRQLCGELTTCLNCKNGHEVWDRTWPYITRCGLEPDKTVAQAIASFFCFGLC